MLLLDANAVIALLTAGPASAQIADLLRQDAGSTSVNLGEAVDVLERRLGLARERIRSAIDTLLLGAFHVVSVDGSIGRRAGVLRAHHYHRRACPVSPADCVLLAAAGSGDRVVTWDASVLAVAAKEGISTVALPAPQRG